MQAAIDKVLAEYGFTEDPNPVSTVVLGGAGLAKSGLTAAYNPAQRRAPKGSRNGGQWVKQGEAQAAAQAVPQFGSRIEAEEWFRQAGIPDVNLSGMETIPDGLKILTGAAESLAKLKVLYPDIIGENGLKILTTTGDERFLTAVMARGEDPSGAWAITMPADDLIDPYLLPKNGSRPFPSTVIFADVRDDLAIYRMAEQGMAPQTYEQAFAHELGHVHENAIGYKQSVDSYIDAAAATENAMARERGLDGFESEIADSGYMTDQMAQMLDFGISPYTRSSPREGFAEHFVRRTYPDSYERARQADPDAVRWADYMAEEYNRLMGEKQL